MPNVSIKDIQSAITDSIGINTFNGEESSEKYDIHSIFAEGVTSCSEFY